MVCLARFKRGGEGSSLALLHYGVLLFNGKILAIEQTSMCVFGAGVDMMFGGQFCADIVR